MSDPQTTVNATLASESYDEKFNRMKKRKEERESKTMSELEYDAILKNARWLGKSLSGHIYGDKKGRFTDGTLVTTSTVSHSYNMEIYHTRNSVYKVEFEHEQI